MNVCYVWSPFYIQMAGDASYLTQFGQSLAQL